MKTRSRILSVLCLAVFLCGFAAGCAATGSSDVEIMDIDETQELVPLGETPALATTLSPVASGTAVEENSKVRIDYSNSADGYVMVKYLGTDSAKLKVLITGPSGTTYTYNLRNDGQYEVFPFSDGNGSYTVGAYKNTSGTKYATMLKRSIDVKLTDEFAPFLRPNQYVNFSADSEVVKLAAELTKGKSTLLDKVAAVYDYVVGNFTYDKQLAATVQSGYLPDVDKVLAAKKGICFDYAAVMAAMLRSQNIPCKLVVGYAGTAYHAWISVYSEESGWIDGAIYFNGKNWERMDPTFASTGNQSSAIMQYIGDGSNYSAKYLY